MQAENGPSLSPYQCVLSPSRLRLILTVLCPSGLRPLIPRQLAKSSTGLRSSWAKAIRASGYHIVYLMPNCTYPHSRDKAWHKIRGANSVPFVPLDSRLALGGAPAKQCPNLFFDLPSHDSHAEMQDWYFTGPILKQQEQA